MKGSRADFSPQGAGIEIRTAHQVRAFSAYGPSPKSALGFFALGTTGFYGSMG
jgi:hypothetical protein